VTATFGGAVTATPVPTVSAVRIQAQFASRLALGQIDGDRLSTIAEALVQLLGVPSSRLTLATFLATGAVSIVRFTVVYPAGSDTSAEAVVADVSAAAANASAPLSLTALPVAASVAIVVDCTGVCANPGTASSFRNADNTACQCTCTNQWSGTRCETCASPFSGAACDTCADGFTGYPTCFADLNCTQPSATRVSITQSADCTAAMGSSANAAIRGCIAASCSCLGGTYDVARQACLNPTARDSCQQLLCNGEAERCFLRARLVAMRDAHDDCANDTARLTGSLLPLERWCLFDTCTDTTLANCTVTESEAACGRLAVGDFSAAFSLGAVPSAMLLFMLLGVTW